MWWYLSRALRTVAERKPHQEEQPKATNHSATGTVGRAKRLRQAGSHSLSTHKGRPKRMHNFFSLSLSRKEITVGKREVDQREREGPEQMIGWKNYCSVNRKAMKRQGIKEKWVERSEREDEQ